MKYSALVGEVTYASNALHAVFFLLFRMMFIDEEDDVAGAVWHALRSDDLQRAALKAAALKCQMHPKRTIKSLLWVLDRAGRLAEFRNDAIHTIFDYGPTGRGIDFGPSDWAAQPKRAEKLNRVGHKKLFRLVIGDLNQLNDYAGHVAGSIIDRKHGFQRAAFPKRPALRSVLLVQQSPPL